MTFEEECIHDDNLILQIIESQKLTYYFSCFFAGTDKDFYSFITNSNTLPYLSNIFENPILKKFETLYPINDFIIKDINLIIDNYWDYCPVAKKYLFDLCLLALYVQCKAKSMFAYFSITSDKYTYFRGQADECWSITPSFLRNIKQNTVVDYSYLEKVYKDSYLFLGYTNHIKNKKQIDHEVLSFIQHACSYTPYLDFTKDMRIAEVFAISEIETDKQADQYDSKIFIISPPKGTKIYRKNKEITDFLKEKFFIVSVSNISLGENITAKMLKDGDFIDFNIKIDSLKTLFENLTPHYILIDKPDNDRMKYQKGVFVLFYGCLCVNNHIFYSLDENCSIRYSIIKGEEKKSRYSKLKTECEPYEYKYLLNPYMGFYDQLKEYQNKE